MDRALTRSSRLLALEGIAAIVFGIVVLIWPGMTLVGLLALVGAFALVSGVLVLASGLSLLAQRRDDWVPFVLGGLAGIVVGAVTFLRPGITVLALVYLIAVWAIITGVFEIVAAVDLHGETRGEWWLAIAGSALHPLRCLAGHPPGCRRANSSLVDRDLRDPGGHGATRLRLPGAQRPDGRPPGRPGDRRPGGQPLIPLPPRRALAVVGGRPPQSPP